MHILELFQYANPLYINMWYYTIRPSAGIEDMTMIVTEFGKFKYNYLHIGIFTLGDISRAKVDNLIGDIKSVKTYINDISVLIKEIFYKNI